MNCKQFKDLIFSDQDGQLSERAKADFERHRKTCPVCARQWNDTWETGEFLQKAASPLPAPDWDGSWRRIAAAVPFPRRRGLLLTLPRWAMLTAAFLAVFALGVAVARLAFFPAKALVPASMEPAFIYTAGDYFAALQPVMASYANDPGSQGNAPADQTRVRRLLSDLYLLKLRAARSRDTSLQNLLGDIELVLLEMAHLDRSDPEQVRQVGAMIQEKGISLKMKVYKLDGRKPVRI